MGTDELISCSKDRDMYPIPTVSRKGYLTHPRNHCPFQTQFYKTSFVRTGRTVANYMYHVLCEKFFHIFSSTTNP